MTSGPEEVLEHIHDICAAYYGWTKAAEREEDVDFPQQQDTAVILGHIMAISTMRSLEEGGDPGAFLENIRSQYEEDL